MFGGSKEDEDAIFLALLIEDAIKQLPIKQRIVVALKVAGFTQQECSEILGITSVWFLFRKAREQLLMSLKDLLYE